MKEINMLSSKSTFYCTDYINVNPVDLDIIRKDEVNSGHLFSIFKQLYTNLQEIFVDIFT